MLGIKKKVKTHLIDSADRLGQKIKFFFTLLQYNGYFNSSIGWLY